MILCASMNGMGGGGLGWEAMYAFNAAGDEMDCDKVSISFMAD